MPDTGNQFKKGGILLVLGLLAINVFWGASFIANAIALKYVGPIEIASVRFFIAVPILLVVTFLLKGKEIFKFDFKDAGLLLVIALTGVTFQYIVQVTAQEYTTATNVSLLINTSVFFIMFMGALWLGEKMTPARLIGAVVGFVGVAFLVTGGSLAFDLGGHVTGDIMALASGLMWAIYSICSKKLAPKYDPLVLLNYIFLVGAICMIPFYLVMPHTAIQDIPMTAMAAILFLAIFCSIIAYFVYNLALEKMEASSVALFIYIVPLATIILAILVLGEKLTFSAAIGGFLILAGMYLAERK